MRYFAKKLVGFCYRVVFHEAAAVITDGIRHGLLIPPCFFPSPSGSALQYIISSDYFPITGVMKVSSSCIFLSSGYKETGGVLHIFSSEGFIGETAEIPPTSEGTGRRVHFWLFLPWLRRSRPRSPSSSANSTFTQDSFAMTQRSLLNIWFSNALTEVGFFFSLSIQGSMWEHA